MPMNKQDMAWVLMSIAGIFFARGFVAYTPQWEPYYYMVVALIIVVFSRSWMKKV